MKGIAYCHIKWVWYILILKTGRVFIVLQNITQYILIIFGLDVGIF